MKNQVKIYKNKLRNVPTPQERYVPNYQQLGIDPEEQIRSAHVGEIASGRLPMRPKPVRVHTYVTQPYAEEVSVPVGSGAVPNVGNSMEHTWSSIDGEIIDDLPTSPDAAQEFIDNNDYMTPEALGQPSFGNNVRNRNPFAQAPSQLPVPMQPPEQDLLSVVSDLEADTYLLIVNGDPICSGPLQEIEEETSALVLGNHEMFDGRPVPEEEIIVLKKIKIKVGVFLS